MVESACQSESDAAHEDANIIWGAAIDESLDDEIRVTVIATGAVNENDTRKGKSSINSDIFSGADSSDDDYGDILNLLK